MTNDEIRTAFVRAYVELRQNVDLDLPVPDHMVGPVSASAENAHKIVDRALALLVRVAAR